MTTQPPRDTPTSRLLIMLAVIAVGLLLLLVSCSTLLIHVGRLQLDL